MVNRGGERGGALLLALAVVALAALAVGTALGGLQQEIDAVRRADTGARLRALADAGIAATLARLTVDENAGDIEQQRFGGGQAASSVVRVDRDTVDVVVTATTRESSLTVTVRVRLDEAGPTVLWWRGAGLAVSRSGDARGRRTGSGRPGH
jgi:type II secretory pathway component PulK